MLKVLLPVAVQLAVHGVPYDPDDEPLFADAVPPKKVEKRGKKKATTTTTTITFATVKPARKEKKAPVSSEDDDEDIVFGKPKAEQRPAKLDKPKKKAEKEVKEADIPDKKTKKKKKKVAEDVDDDDDDSDGGFRGAVTFGDKKAKMYEEKRYDNVPVPDEFAVEVDRSGILANYTDTFDVDKPWYNDPSLSLDLTSDLCLENSASPLNTNKNDPEDHPAVIQTRNENGGLAFDRSKWGDRAVAAAQSGDFVKAIAMFKEVLKHIPNAGGMWKYYALAAISIAGDEKMKQDFKTQIRLLREALAAFDIAWMLRDDVPENMYTMAYGRLTALTLGLKQNDKSFDSYRHPVNLEGKPNAFYRHGGAPQIPVDCLLEGTCGDGEHAMSLAWKMVGPRSYEPHTDEIKAHYFSNNSTGLHFAKRDVSEEDRRYIRVDAAKILCQKKEHMSIRISQKDIRRGWIPARLLRRLKIAFDVCGVIHLPDIFSKEIIDRVKASQEHHLAYLKRKEVEEVRLQDLGLQKMRYGLQDQETNATVGLFGSLDMMRSIPNGTKPDFDKFHTATESAEAGLRGDGRYEVKLPFESPFICPALTQNRIVFSLLKSFLGHKIEIDEFSYITLERKSKEMHWHQDVDWIFANENFLDEKSQLPPHAIVMVLPLLDMSVENGPTEFIAGTHNNVGGSRLYWWRRLHFWQEKYGLSSHADEEDKELALLPPRLHFTGDRGGVTLFDLRLFHRGRPNRSDIPRTVLYISYVQDWFQDKVNFKEPHSVMYDKLPDDGSRKLMGRAEMRSYLRNLEKFAEKALYKLGATLDNDGSGDSTETGETIDSNGVGSTNKPTSDSPHGPTGIALGNDEKSERIATLEKKLSDIRSVAEEILGKTTKSRAGGRRSKGGSGQTMLQALGYDDGMVQRISATEDAHHKVDLQK